jgi:hypothetical protein
VDRSPVVTSIWRALRIALAVGLIGVTAYGGINDGLSTAREAATPLQSIVAAMQLVYGGLSLAVLLAMAFRPRLVNALLIPWAVALAAVGSMAPVVWGEAGWAAGAAGGVATAAVAALVIAAWRAHLRWRSSAPA